MGFQNISWDLISWDLRGYKGISTLTRGLGGYARPRKSSESAIFLHSKHQKSNQETLRGTKAATYKVCGQTWSFIGPYIPGPSNKDIVIFEILQGRVQGGRITGNQGTRFPGNLKVSQEILIVNPTHLSRKM